MGIKHKIIFSVHAGKKAGYGHLARNLALAEVFIDESYECKFIIKSDAPESVYDFLNIRTVYNIATKLFDTSSSNQQELDLIQYEFQKGPSFLILDHYGHDEIFRSQLKNMGIRWAQFDYKKTERIIADAVINSNIGVSQNDYIHLVEKNALLCVGEKYAIIRKELLKYNHDPIPNRILISMGGGEYPDKIQELIKLTVSDNSFHFEVVTNSIQLIEGIGQNNNVSIHNNPLNIGEIYSRCEAGIVAGGVTTYELAYIGVPMIMIPFVKNQADNAKAWDFRNFGINFEHPEYYKANMNSVGFKQILENLFKHFASKSSIIDGHGASNISKSIINYIQNGKH